MEEKEPILYEIGYLLNDNLKEEGIVGFFEKLRNKVTEHKGFTIAEGSIKKQVLAYPIAKNETALFNWTRIKVTPGAIEDIKKHMEQESAVLRFLVIKLGKEENAPQPTIIKRRTEKKSKIEEAKPKTEEEEKIKEEEIDKKIEELLGE